MKIIEQLFILLSFSIKVFQRLVVFCTVEFNSEFMMILTVCMVSTFKFPKMMKRDGIYINSFQAINFIVSCYCAVTRSYPEFLFSMGLFLLISGIIAGFFAKVDQNN